MRVVWTRNATRELRVIHDASHRIPAKYARALVDRITNEPNRSPSFPGWVPRSPNTRMSRSGSCLSTPIGSSIGSTEGESRSFRSYTVPDRSRRFPRSRLNREESYCPMRRVPGYSLWLGHIGDVCDVLASEEGFAQSSTWRSMNLPQP